MKILIASTLLSAVSAVLSALLTNYLALGYFWRRQRLSEQRIKVIEEINLLAAEYMTGLTHLRDKGDYFMPEREFFQSVLATAAKLKALFSSSAWHDYMTMEVMMVSQHDTDVGNFREAHRQLIKTLLNEI